MKYRDLGTTGLRVSEIGFGTIPILSGNVPVLPVISLSLQRMGLRPSWPFTGLKIRRMKL